MERTAGSAFGKTVEQFVRQVLRAGKPDPVPDKPWERAIDSTRARLVLAVGRTASLTITSVLPTVLTKVRLLPENASLSDSADTEPEKQALSVTSNHIETAWRAFSGKTPSERQIWEPLSLIYVQVLDVDPGGSQEREAKDTQQEHQLPMSPPDRYTLTFAHHLLFDYAVARLLFRTDPVRLVTEIASDPEQVMAFRPSLALHFRYEWEMETVLRSRFWNLVFWFNQAPEIPLIGKIIGPTEAVELVEKIQDLKALLVKVTEESASGANNLHGKDVLHHFVGALMTRDSSPDQLVGPNAKLWCEFAAELSKSVAVVAYPLAQLITLLSERFKNFTPEQLGRSQIMPLLSNVGQDWRGIFYVLAQAYPAFLNSAPIAATQAVVAVLAAWVAREHAPASGDVIEHHFQFAGVECAIRTDYSAIWDSASVSRTDRYPRVDRHSKQTGRRGVDHPRTCRFFKLARWNTRRKNI